MAIRIEHQPAGYAVGMAAYLAGRGKARERQQKDAMTMWREQNRYGNLYRRAMGGQRRATGDRQIAEQPGTWEDPLVFDEAGKTPEEIAGQRKGNVQIKAQRRANERARRSGKPMPYQAARPQFTPAPTKEEVQRKQDVEDRGFRARQHTKQDELEGWQGESERLAAAVSEIDKSAGGHFTPEGRAARDKLRQDLKALDKDRDAKGDEGGRMSDPEWHQARAEMYGEYLDKFKRDQHVKPLEQRPDYERITKDGRKQRRTPEGHWETVELVDEGVMTREQVDRGESQNLRPSPLGGYRRRVLGRGGVVEWEDVKMPEAPSYGETYNKWSTNFLRARDNRLKELGKTEQDPDALEEANAHALKLFPKPVEGGDSGPAAPGAPGGDQAGRPKVVVGDDDRPVVPEEPTAPGRSSFPGAGGVVPQVPAAAPPQPTAAPAAQPAPEAVSVLSGQQQVAGQEGGQGPRRRGSVTDDGQWVIITDPNNPNEHEVLPGPKHPNAKLSPNGIVIITDPQKPNEHRHYNINDPSVDWGDEPGAPGGAPAPGAPNAISAEEAGRAAAMPLPGLPGRAAAPAGQQPAAAGSVKAKAIAAALAGDPNAQRALDERGIPWRQ